MSPSAFTVYSHLPPTTNILNSQQRSRLIRSTRKLNAVLGTTPCPLENDTSHTLLPLGKDPSKALKRQGSIFTCHQTNSSSSSTSTVPLHRPSPSTSSATPPQSDAPGTLLINPDRPSIARKPRPNDKVPLLSLRLDTAAVPPADDCVLSSSSPCTPLTPSPISPVVPDVAETRRKQMAKLARHFGENIPVELVLSAESPAKPATVSLSRPPTERRHCVHAMRTQVPCICDNRPTFGQSDWVGQWNRSTIKDVQNELRKLRAG